VRPRTLLVLFVVVLGLGAFIWLYERKLPSSEKRQELAKKVLPLDKEKVAAVTLEWEGRQVRLERVPPPATGKGTKKGGKEAAPAPADAEWRLTKPLAARADTAAVDGLLDALSGLEKTRTLDDVQPAAVGLDRPRALVRVDTADGHKVLKIGAEVPTGGATLAGLAGEKRRAYVVSDSILNEIRKPPGDWRDRRMFPAERDAVTRIALAGAAGANGKVVLARRGDRFWIESPLADSADRERVDGLLADLTGLTAEKFLDSPPRPLAELGLAPPRQSVEVDVQGKPPVHVDLGAPVPAAGTPPGQTGGELTYARVGDQLFEARTRLAEAVGRAPADWRSPALSAFEVYQIESAAAKDAAGAFTLTRSGTDWKRGNDTLSYLPVSDFLFALTGARAERLLAADDARAMGIALDRPELTVDLKAGAAGAETLTLYPAVAAGVPARASGREAVLLLPADKAKDIRDKLAAVRSAKPVAAKPAKKKK
jgi:uncharacterized protein DUF4340